MVLWNVSWLLGNSTEQENRKKCDNGINKTLEILKSWDSTQRDFKQ